MFYKHDRCVLYTLALLLATLISACDSKIEWSDGNYRLRSIDTPELFLSYTDLHGQDLVLVEADVVAIGSDPQQIIVKQRQHQSRAISYVLINRRDTGSATTTKAHSLLRLSEADYFTYRKNASWPTISHTFFYP